MTNVLGHDINGRPLRVGDEVVVVKARLKENLGQTARVLCNLGKIEGFAGDERLGLDRVFMADQGSKINHARQESLRKLHDDHRPANESFGEMMAALVGNKRVGA